MRHDSRASTDRRSGVRARMWICVLALLCLWVVLAPSWAATGAEPADALAAWRPFTALRAHTVATGQQGHPLRHTVSVGEDALGRIWIGDYAGVSRLDGDVQRRFEGADIEVMAEGYTHAFFPLPNGEVLVGGDREGLLRFDHLTEQFSTISLASGERLTRINALAPAGDGQVWVASEQGLFRWKPGSRHLMPDSPSGREQAASKRVFDVQQMPDGTLWLAAQPGLYRRAPGQTQWQPVALDNTRLQHRLRKESAWSLASDDRGRLWVGLMQSGVVVLDGKGGAFAPAGLDGHVGLHQGRTIRALLWEPLQQRMFVGTDGVGLLEVQGRQAGRLPVILSEFTGGRNFHVRDLLRARDGRIWAATDRGVFHMDPQPGRVIEIDASEPGKDPYESPSTVRTLMVDSRGRIWLGQYGGIVQVLDPSTGKRSVVHLPAPLDGTHVTGMASDRHGRIWVIGNGVVWVDEKTLKVSTAGAIGREPMRRYVDVASNGDRVWLSHNEGLVELDRDGNVLRRMESASDGLHSTRLNLLVFHDGDLWVGSAEGLHVVDLKTWRARLVPFDGLKVGQAMYQTTASLMCSGSGIWAGTLQGISYARNGENTLKLVMPTGGDEVRGLVNAGHGGVWFARDGKPSRIGRLAASGAIDLVQIRQGLHPKMALQGKGFAVTAEGVLVAPIDTGAVMIDPAVFDQEPPALPDLSPRLLDVSVDGQHLPASQLPSGHAPLELEHDVERLEMTFSAVDYIAPQLRHYSFRLEGLDSRWVKAHGGTPRLFYSRLPAGSYTLLLRTTSGEYPGREWITRIPLEVAPSWYENRWSWLLLGIGTVMLVIGLVQLRIAQVRRHQAHLQTMVQARTRQLQQANERLARQASEDALTGLDSRRRGLEKLGDLIARRRRVSGEDAVMLLDLDYFKQINDTHGHLAGDEVLREVARRLRRELREVDIAIRYGGEELLVVLPDTGLQAAVGVAERLAHALRSAPVIHDGKAIDVTASFGVSPLLPELGVENTLALADEALYQAKSDGRDCVRVAHHATCA